MSPPILCSQCVLWRPQCKFLPLNLHEFLYLIFYFWNQYHEWYQISQGLLHYRAVKKKYHKLNNIIFQILFFQDDIYFFKTTHKMDEEVITANNKHTPCLITRLRSIKGLITTNEVRTSYNDKPVRCKRPAKFRSKRQELNGKHVQADLKFREWRIFTTWELKMHFLGQVRWLSDLSLHGQCQHPIMLRI